MARNWLTAWLSKLIKVPFFVRRQMRRREKVIMRVLPHMKYFIYKLIPEEVLKKHTVTRAMKDEVKVGKYAKKAEKAEYDLGFDEEVLETLSLREITKTETILLEHEEQHGAIGYEADFGKKILTIFAIELADERKVYFTYLEPIIRVAERKGDYKTLMEEIRILGPPQTNVMAAIALRLDIRLAGRGVPKLRGDRAVLEAALNKWDKAEGDKQAQEEHIRTALAETEKDIEKILHSDALILKRDFLLTLLTLKYIDDDEALMQRYYISHVMPKLPENEKIRDFEELKKKFAEDMHVLAQGMRRIFKTEKEVEKLAEQIVAVASTKKAEGVRWSRQLPRKARS